MVSHAGDISGRVVDQMIDLCNHRTSPEHIEKPIHSDGKTLILISNDLQSKLAYEHKFKFYTKFRNLSTALEN